MKGRDRMANVKTNRCPVSHFRKLIAKELDWNEAQVAMMFDVIMYAMIQAFEEGYDSVKVLPCILVERKENSTRTIILNGQEIESRDYYKLVASMIDGYRKYGDACVKILDEYEDEKYDY